MKTIVSLLLGSLLVAASSGCYLAHAAWEQARILAARQPIEQLLETPRLPDSARAKLALVVAARAFAGDSLRLTPGGSFTTYADVGRDTLLLVLSAAARDTLRPYVWQYPIVGRLPYRGYFDFGAAQRHAARLNDEGYDVYLRPSDAFSTLGWFNDPLLSTTLARDSVDLVNTVLHEMTHTTLFLTGHADFNESFASFVGSRGAEAFFASQGLPAAAVDARDRWHDERVLAVFWAGLVRQLDSAFAAIPDREGRLVARAEIYASARGALLADVAPRFRRISPLYAERVQLNNASVLARRVYGRGFDLFEEVYAREGDDLALAVARVIQLARSRPDDPFGALREWLDLLVSNRPRDLHPAGDRLN